MKKLVFFILTGLFVFTNILTFSRGGFLGMVAIGIYIWVKSSRKVAYALVIVMLSTVMVFLAPENYGDRLRSITEEGTSSGSGADRVYTWGIAWDMFKDNPFFGVGQGNAPWEFRKYEIAAGFEEGYFGRSRAGRAMHSIYFTLLPELGLVGTLLFGLMVYQIWKDTRRIRNKLKSKGITSKKGEEIKDLNLVFSMEASLIGFLVSGIFISILYYPNFWILTGFVVCYRRLICGENEKHTPSH